MHTLPAAVLSICNRKTEKQAPQRHPSEPGPSRLEPDCGEDDSVKRTTGGKAGKGHDSFLRPGCGGRQAERPRPRAATQQPGPSSSPPSAAGGCIARCTRWYACRQGEHICGWNGCLQNAQGLCSLMAGQHCHFDLTAPARNCLQIAFAKLESIGCCCKVIRPRLRQVYSTAKAQFEGSELQAVARGIPSWPHGQAAGRACRPRPRPVPPAAARPLRASPAASRAVPPPRRRPQTPAKATPLWRRRPSLLRACLRRRRRRLHQERGRVRSARPGALAAAPARRWALEWRSPPPHLSNAHTNGCPTLLRAAVELPTGTHASILQGALLGATTAAHSRQYTDSHDTNIPRDLAPPHSNMEQSAHVWAATRRARARGRGRMRRTAATAAPPPPGTPGTAAARPCRQRRVPTWPTRRGPTRAAPPPLAARPPPPASPELAAKAQ